MTVLASMNFDAGTEAGAVNGSVSAPFSYVLSAGGTSNVYLAAAAIHGTRGMRATDVAHQNVLKYDNGSAIAQMVDSYYFKIDTMPGAAVFLGQFNDATNTKICDWRVNVTSGVFTISLRNSSSTSVYTSTGKVLTAGTVYRAEWLCQASNQQMKIFTGESTTALIDSGLVATGTTNTPRYCYCGVQAATTAPGQINFDTWRIADDFVGPFVPGTPRYQAFVKKSGVWVPATIQVGGFH